MTRLWTCHDKTHYVVYSQALITTRTQDEIIAKTMRLISTLTNQYQQLFASCTVLPQHRASVERLTAQLLQHQVHYEQTVHKTLMPWPVMAVIHALEANQNFHRHLHNGNHCTAAQSMYRHTAHSHDTLHLGSLSH